MNRLPQISDAEYEVMKIVWKHTPISTNEVVEMLSGVSSWRPKTIQTLLLRLVKKKALAYHKESRVFVYTPLLQEQEYLESESRTFLKRFYNGTINAMVLSFLEQGILSDQEIEHLRKLLNHRDGESE